MLQRLESQGKTNYYQSLRIKRDVVFLNTNKKAPALTYRVLINEKTVKRSLLVLGLSQN